MTPAAPAHRRPNRLRPAAAAIAFACLLIVVLAAPLAAEDPASPPLILSVLDFEDNTGDEEWAWLGAGLADMLLTDLAVDGLSLVDRGDLDAVLEEQSLALTGLTDDEALTVGRLLSADAILSGGYAVAGGTLRLDARVIDVTTGGVRGAASAEGPGSTVFALEAALATALCAELGVRPPQQPVGAGTASVPAARSYYEGLALQASGDVEAARARFEAAARLDPLYPKPRYSLEESWRLLEDFRNLRRQRELNALWRKAEALAARLAAEPFVGDAEAIMAAYTAGTPTVSTGSPPEDDPTLGSCPSPAVCLWNLQITYWEIGSLSAEHFDDEATEEASLREVVRLAREAEEAWPEDEWLPEVLYWEVFALRWLGEWPAVKTGCERFFVEWPDFRMAWALEDMYEAALEALGG